MTQETDDQEDQLLNLSLALDTGCGDGGGRKRKIRDELRPLNPYEGQEGKILGLLHTREQMLKQVTKREDMVEGGKGLHLIHLLLISATAIDENNMASAADNLTELYQKVSLTGDSVQRVVAYFADGLVARVLTRKSPFYDMIMKGPTHNEEFSAFTELYRASPYYQFAHFTANQAIIEAFEQEEERNKRSSLHVIDFEISYGFQWPSLIQSLSEKATNGNRINLRITGFSRSLEELVETESRLMNFSKGFHNIAFEFQGLLRGSKPGSLKIKKKEETVAVNLVFHLHTLTNSLQIFDTFKYVHSLNPSIVILVEQEVSRSTRSFLSRFMESLYYFAAMFDSLDDCLPSKSAERLSIEKNHLGKEIKNMMNYEKNEENYQGYERLETWKERMEGHGFKGVKLSSRSVIQAKLLLKIRSHCSSLEVDGVGGGFRVFERDEGRALSLGWQDRHLITASAWNCV